MYFKRLKLTDFGPIRNIEFHFEKDKVYHFIGKNDSGKSMILDAMNIVCNNIPGMHVKKYVSDYSDNFIIEAEDFEGNIIELQRGEVSWYKLTLPNGEVKFYDKIGGGVPVSIQNIVNVYVDDMKKEKFNFRYSDDKILFMNTTPGENYSFFQKALGTDKVLNALKKANTLQNKYEKEIDITKSKIDYEEEKLEENPEINYVKDDITLYQESIKETMYKLKLIYEVITRRKYLNELNNIMVPEEVVEFDWGKQKEERDKLSNIKELIINFEKLDKLNKLHGNNKEISEKKENINNQYAVIKNIGDYNKLSKTMGNMSKKVDSLIELGEETENVKRLKDEVESIISKIYIMNEVEELKEKEKILSGTLDNVDTIVDILNNRLKVHKTALIRTKELTGQLDELRGITEKVNINSKLVIEIDNEKSKFMREHNFCPVVVNSLDKKCPFNNKTLEEIMKGVV